MASITLMCSTHECGARCGAPTRNTQCAWWYIAPEIDAIRRLKRERNAIVLAHNYQRPEIFEVADFVGDSLELARNARDVRDAEGRGR